MEQALVQECSSATKGSFQDLSEELENFQASLERRASKNRALTIALLVMSVLIPLYLLFSVQIHEMWLGERDFWGDWSYHPRYPVGLDKVDLKKIHTTGFTDYIAGLGAEDKASRHRAFKRFKALLQNDANLLAILEELHKLILERTGVGLTRESQVSRKRERTQYLVWAWNHYLKQNKKPWKIEAEVTVYPKETVLYGVSYKIVTYKHYKFDGYPIRVKWLRRVDNLNLEERYLGHASRPDSRSTEALVVLQQVESWAIKHLWPMVIQHSNDSLHQMAQAFAPHIRTAMQKQLPSRHFRTLKRAWHTKKELETLHERFNEKQRCHGYTYDPIPWNGWSTKSTQAFMQFAKQFPKCIRFTKQESEQFAKGHLFLKGNAFQKAIAVLGEWVARGISIHEARHIADWKKYRDNRFIIPCPGCPKGLSKSSISELSAYSASFSQKDIALITLYQACGLLHGSDEGHGTSEQAVNALLQLLLPKGCDKGPPKAFWKKAKSLDTKLFGRVRSIQK